MSDVAIQPAGLPDYRSMLKITPIYLVTLSFGKNETYFLATKFDACDAYGKFVGFYYTSPIDSISDKYEEAIKTTDSTKFVEIMFPWTKINSVRSLMYKHKTGEKK